MCCLDAGVPCVGCWRCARRKGTQALLQLGGLDLEEIPWLRHGTRLGGEAAELGGVLLIGRWKGCRWGGCVEERKEKMIGLDFR